MKNELPISYFFEKESTESQQEQEDKALKRYISNNDYEPVRSQKKQEHNSQNPFEVLDVVFPSSRSQFSYMPKYYKPSINS